MQKTKLVWLILGGIILTAVAAALFLNRNILVSSTFPLHQKWSAKLPSSIEDLSTNGGDIVFVRTGWRLTALDAKSGKTLWMIDYDHRGRPKPAVASGGRVFFADGRQVWAVNEKDGTVAWKADFPNFFGIVLDASTQYVAVRSDQDIAIFDANTGSLLWNKPVCRNYDTANINPPFVYVPCLSIRAMNISTGEDVWEKEQDTYVPQTVYKDNILYFTHGNNISAFQVGQQKTLWTSFLEDRGYLHIKTSGEFLTVTGGHRFCLLKPTADSGNTLWCSDHSSPNPQNPVILNNRLYVFNGYQNRITAYGLETGDRIGDLQVKQWGIGTIYRERMVSTGDTLIFGSGNMVFGYGE